MSNNLPKIEEFDEIKFTIIREPWNIYQLDPSGVEIKLRWILTRLLVTTKSNDPNKLDIILKNQHLMVPTKLSGHMYSDKITIQNIPPNEYNKYIVREESYDTVTERWNEYQFKYKGQAHRLRIKNSLNEVHLTSVITMDREPMYIVNHETKMNVKKIEDS